MAELRRFWMFGARRGRRGPVVYRSFLKGSVLCCVLSLSPSDGSGQSSPMDTVTARELLLEAERALQLSDSLRMNQRFQSNLSSLLRAWGIERQFPQPDEFRSPIVRMDSILRGTDLDSAFEIARGFDEGDGFQRYRRAFYEALIQQGRLIEALEHGFGHDQLDWAVSAAARRSTAPEETDREIRTWLEQVSLPEEQERELLISLVEWKCEWDFWGGWQEAERSLDPSGRAWVHLLALPDAIWDGLPEADSLIGVVAREIDLIEDEKTREHYLGMLNTWCVSADLPACEDRVWPVGLHTAGHLRMRTINQFNAGEWDEAMEALERFKSLASPIQVATVRAEALDGADPHCTMRVGKCERRAFDSLFTSWVPELEAIESEYPGPAGDTLRAHLAQLWGGRDAKRSADFARRISDDDLRAWAVIVPIQAAYRFDVWGALELARIARDAGDPFVPSGAYVLLLRLGEADLAQEVLGMHPESGPGRLWDQLDWAQMLEQQGRSGEARELARNAYRDWDPGRYPVFGTNQLHVFASMDLIDEMIEWAREHDDPAAKAGAFASIVSSFTGRATGG